MIGGGFILRVLRGSDKNFNYRRLYRDLKLLQLPTDFNLIILDEIKTYWGLYHSSKKLIKSYVAGLSYETAFPHILHESIHHYQHYHQKYFKRKYGVMHDKIFKLLMEAKLNEWCLLYRDWR